MNDDIVLAPAPPDESEGANEEHETLPSDSE
jgi:hypothetical protein